MSGTDLGYAATRTRRCARRSVSEPPVCGHVVCWYYSIRYLPTRALCDVQYQRSVGCYARARRCAVLS
eukprot:3940960-Rhodomonas_salina.1